MFCRFLGDRLSSIEIKVVKKIPAKYDWDLNSYEIIVGSNHLTDLILVLEPITVTVTAKLVSTWTLITLLVKISLPETPLEERILFPFNSLITVEENTYPGVESDAWDNVYVESKLLSYGRLSHMVQKSAYAYSSISPSTTA